MFCPVCGGRSVGKVGVEQFYCWDCFIEYQRHGSKIRIYSVAEDGSLVDYEPLLVN